jgi:N6-adenosine-specific RNA methylase IME4
MLYDVILADPPWPYRVWSEDTGAGRSAASHYPTMSLADICALPMAKLAAENCALFLWAVWPSIFEARDVIQAWGFEYKTKAWTWIKANKNGFGFFTGMGYYTRANDEPCLLAIKGRMPVAAHDVQALIYAPVRAHSQKPQEQYDKIAKLYPGGKCIELFARKRRQGWDAFGDEIENSIEL